MPLLLIAEFHIRLEPVRQDKLVNVRFRFRESLFRIMFLDSDSALDRRRETLNEVGTLLDADLFDGGRWARLNAKLDDGERIPRSQRRIVDNDCTLHRHMCREVFRFREIVVARLHTDNDDTDGEHETK